MNRILMIVLSICLLSCDKLPALPESVVRVSEITKEERVVRAYVDAFNSHDVEAMLAFCDEDLGWFQVSATEASLEGAGKNQLAEQLRAYFSATPDIRSEVEDLHVTGNTVSVVERVRWTPNGSAEQKTQSSMSVYLFKDGLISRVWYFPVQP